MSDVETNPVEVLDPKNLPEGWSQATTSVAPTAKFVDSYGTYHDENRKIVAFTQLDGSVKAAE
jgi:hypothetical protein